MADPNTSVIDNGNVGTDAAPPDANWSRFIGQANDFKALATSGQFCAAHGLIGWDYYNAATPGPDCEIGMTIATLPANAERLWFFLGIANPTSLSTYTGYDLLYTRVNGSNNDTFQINRVDAGNVSWQIALNNTTDLVAADKLCLQRIGSTLTAFRWNGTAWVSLCSATDATYTAAGRIALGIESDNVRGDDIFGGTRSNVQTKTISVTQGQSVAVPKLVSKVVIP